jgi:hypothetical protein
VNDESVKGGRLDNTGHWWVVEMLLLVLAGLGVLVTENEMNLQKSIWMNRILGNLVTNLVSSSALVWAKHDDVWGGI